MIILREYKSVVFWLVFVSLWIVGSFPCCNEEDNFSKIENLQRFNEITSNITRWSMNSKKKWTFFKITITTKDKNNKITLGIRNILSEKYINNAAAGNNNVNVNNIDIDKNNINENEDDIFKNLNNHKLNVFIPGYSDENFIAGEMDGNANNNDINEGNNNINEENNNEKGTKTYYYVLIKDITTRADVYGSLFSALEKTAIDKNFTYSIEVIAADTTEVTDMSSMFYNCKALTKIEGLEKWNTSKVTDLSEIFCECEKLREIESLEKWNINKVTNMSNMFSGCKELTEIKGIEKWDTKNVTNMSNMFDECDKFKRPNNFKQDL